MFSVVGLLFILPVSTVSLKRDTSHTRETFTSSPFGNGRGQGSRWVQRLESDHVSLSSGDRLGTSDPFYGTDEGRPS